MKDLIRRIISSRQRSVVSKPRFKPTFRTVTPEKPMSFDDWMRHYRVSILHGRKPVHIEM